MKNCLVDLLAGKVVQISFDPIPSGSSPHTLVYHTKDSDPVEAGWTWDGRKPIPPGLDIKRAGVIAQVDEIQARLLERGAPVGERFVQVADGSRADLGGMATTALAVMVTQGAVEWPADYALGWIAACNQRIPLPSPQDGLALAAGVGEWYAAVVQYGRTLKDSILASSDPEAIDINQGWPE